MDASEKKGRLDVRERCCAHEVFLDEAKAKTIKWDSLSKKKRKNWMRNKPCVCGSGKKFKRCCMAEAARRAKGQRDRNHKT